MDIGKIIYCFCKALDISSNGIAYHHHSVALIADALAKSFQLPLKQRELIFFSALVHDIGISSQIELRELLLFEDEKPQAHCQKGYEIFSNSKYLEDIGKIILYHHERWDMLKTLPIDADLAFNSNLIYLADRIAVLVEREQKYILHTHHDIIKNISSLSGSSFNPVIIKAFNEIANKEFFWLNLESRNVTDLVNFYLPKKEITIESDEMLDLVACFSKVIDNKCSFTNMHSQNVALISGFLAKKLNFTEQETLFIQVAGYLHDLGKISVPNEILNKPGPLTSEEYKVMQKHAYYSYILLKDIPGFDLVALWSPQHHERLDGSGYPFGLKNHEIPLGSRIIGISDIFSALTEDRPYRKGMEKERCLDVIMQEKAKGYLDESLVDLVAKHYDELALLINY